MSRKRTARPKLSPTQFIKGTIIRLKLAKKVKVRDEKPGPDGTRGARVQFQLIWRRVAILFVILCALGWISLATGGYFFVKEKRNFPDVRFVDIAFPNRWPLYRLALGDYYIKQAQEKLEAGEVEGVLHLLRVGVQQSPDNTEGRLMLAQIYNSIGRPDLGIDLLQARVAEHADDPSYLNPLISLLFANHEDVAVEKLATGLLDGSKEPTDRNLALALAAATANFNRGNYDRAQEFIDDFELLKSRTGTILQARIHWDLGDSEQAILLLERVVGNPGVLEAQAVDYLIEYLWSSGREDRAERVAVSRFIADPLAFAPRLRLLYVRNKRGDTAKEASEIETYFAGFGDDQEAMRGLAEFAAKTAKPDLAKRVLEQVQARRLDSAWPALFLLEAYVAADQAPAALGFYETIEKETSEWTPLQQARLQPILATAYFGAGETERGETVLNEILVLRRGANMSDLLVLAQRLKDMEYANRARIVLNHIHLKQPLNQEALTRLIQLDLETGNNREMVRNIKSLLEMRKPSLTVLETAHSHISSDRFLFQANRESTLESIEAALNGGRPQDS